MPHDCVYRRLDPAAGMEQDAMAEQILRCKRCGCPSVRWMKTTAGKWYLANRTFEGTEGAYGAATAKVPHKCDSHLHHVVAVEDRQAAFAAAAR